MEPGDKVSAQTQCFKKRQAHLRNIKEPLNFYNLKKYKTSGVLHYMDLRLSYILSGKFLGRNSYLQAKRSITFRTFAQDCNNMQYPGVIKLIYYGFL